MFVLLISMHLLSRRSWARTIQNAILNNLTLMVGYLCYIILVKYLKLFRSAFVIFFTSKIFFSGWPSRSQSLSVERKDKTKDSIDWSHLT